MHLKKPPKKARKFKSWSEEAHEMYCSWGVVDFERQWAERYMQELRAEIALKNQPLRNPLTRPFK